MNDPADSEVAAENVAPNRLSRRHVLLFFAAWFLLNPTIVPGGSMLIHHRLMLYSPEYMSSRVGR